MSQPDPRTEEQDLRHERDALQHHLHDDPLRASRTSGFWLGVVALGVVLVLLIVFIAQNTRETTVSFLAWDGQVPVAVALLIAAAAGLFLASVAGALRIFQLRRRVKRERR